MHVITTLVYSVSKRAVMPRLDIDTRRRVILFISLGYSVCDIKKRLEEEQTKISRQALYCLIKKFKETGRLSDMPRRTRPRRLSPEMCDFLDHSLTENDELTARNAHSLLLEKWPHLEVSLPTIKRVRKELEWVCTRPHYCQLIRDVR